MPSYFYLSDYGAGADGAHVFQPLDDRGSTSERQTALIGEQHIGHTFGIPGFAKSMPDVGLGRDLELIVSKLSVERTR